MPSPFPYAPNPAGVQVPPFDFTHPQAPDTQMYHGLYITAAGRTVGRIQEWQTQHYTREGNHIYELNADTSGHPVDYVPGRATNFKAVCSRVEIWNGELEKAFGFIAPFADLTDQNRPFTVEEILMRGPIPYRIWQYLGCWFEEKNRENFTVAGDYQIKVRATIAFVNCIQIL